jgi:hypothetical protein
MAKFLRITISLVMIGGLVTVSSTQTVSAGVQSMSTTNGIFKLTPIESETVPPGCVLNCPTIKSTYPALTSQTAAFAPSLADATQIETKNGAVVSPFLSAQTVCGIISRELWCTGDNSSGLVGDETLTNRDALVKATASGTPLTNITKVNVSQSANCVISNSDLWCISSSMKRVNSQPMWQTVETNVSNFDVWGNSLCILTTSNQVKCSQFNQMLNSGSSWVPSWTTFDAVNTSDVVFVNNDVCVAAAKSRCANFSNSQFTNMRELVGGDNAKRIFGAASAVCIYVSGAMQCGSTTSSNSSTIKIQNIGVMPEPMSVVYHGTPGSARFLFLTNTGILYTDASWVSCFNCPSNSNAFLANVGAFAESTATSYSYVTKVNAITDSPDYLNLSVETGTRKMRSQVSYTVVTESGSPLVGTSIKWAAPDAPGLLASSKTSILSTSDGGLARSTIPSGPVTFTLQYGLSPSGAELQATSLTVIVPESGTFTVKVPDPPAIVDRKISVTLPDNSVVPNALITLKNNYITYAYQSSSAGTSVWAATPKDNSGYMATLNCAYCYATPPTYVTGDDGSVTFKSFAPSVRSGLHDAAIVYDDGELSQTVLHRFAGVVDTVQMAFMAQLNAVIADQNKSTPDVDVRASASGTVDIPVELKDEDNIGISNFTASTESVCSIMDTGGLVSASQSIGGLCSSTIKKMSSDYSAKSASALPQLKVSKSSCSSKRSVQTNASGKAKLRLCVTKSTKVRIRGVGALGSKSVCIRVKNKPCPGSTPVTNMGSRLMDVNAPPKLASLFQINMKAKPTFSFDRTNTCYKSKSNAVQVRSWVKSSIKSNSYGSYTCSITMNVPGTKARAPQRKAITLLLR